jgi:hypothetical protein
MPELASVLGLELDKVFEQEELDAQQQAQSEEDYEEEEEEEFQPPAELQLPKAFSQKTSLQNKRFSTLLTIKVDGDVESHMPARKSSLVGTDTTLADKAAQQSKLSKEVAQEITVESPEAVDTVLSEMVVPEIVEEATIDGKDSVLVFDGLASASSNVMFAYSIVL